MGTLELKVTNFKVDKGQLIVNVFDNPAFFPDRGKHHTRVIVDIEDIDGTMVEIELPYGEYAIVILHDINEDDKCNFNFLGMPTEPYGFTQNYRPLVRAPSFEETKFLFNEDKSMEIKLIQ